MVAFRSLDLLEKVSFSPLVTEDHWIVPHQNQEPMYAKSGFRSDYLFTCPLCRRDIEDLGCSGVSGSKIKDAKMQGYKGMKCRCQKHRYRSQVYISSGMFRS